MHHLSTRLLCFASLVWLSSPTSAHDAAHPDTAKRVREAVELFYQSKPATARPTPAELAFAPQSTCLKPRYPRAARLYELEGTVNLSFQVDAQGRPTNAYIDKGSGWAILDQAALEALADCKYDPGEGGAWEKRSFVFSFD